MKGNISLKAEHFTKRLTALQSDEQLKKHRRYFKDVPDQKDENNYFIGVRMGQIFELAKEFIDMPAEEIEKLLQNPIHEVRAGALSIMGKSAARKKTNGDRLKELYDLYISNHDRINNWDLVDLAAYHVVGRYLEDKPRVILYRLARSKNTWERRTAIVSTAHFIKKGDVEDTFKIAEIVVNDKEDMVHKGTGWMLRYAGSKDREKLLGFLDKHAAAMPRVMLRYAIEHLDREQRDHYLGLKMNTDQGNKKSKQK
jgi:3-methyladenine DNA glycosylase AlkD